MCTQTISSWGPFFVRVEKNGIPQHSLPQLPKVTRSIGPLAGDKPSLPPGYIAWYTGQSAPTAAVPVPAVQRHCFKISAEDGKHSPSWRWNLKMMVPKGVSWGCPFFRFHVKLGEAIPVKTPFGVGEQNFHYLSDVFLGKQPMAWMYLMALWGITPKLRWSSLLKLLIVLKSKICVDIYIYIIIYMVFICI